MKVGAAGWISLWCKKCEQEARQVYIRWRVGQGIDTWDAEDVRYTFPACMHINDENQDILIGREIAAVAARGQEPDDDPI